MSADELPPINDEDLIWVQNMTDDFLALSDGRTIYPVGSPPTQVRCLESDPSNEFGFLAQGSRVGTFRVRVGSDEVPFRFGPGEGVTRAHAARQAAEHVVRHTTWDHPGTPGWQTAADRGELVNVTALGARCGFGRPLMIEPDVASRVFGFASGSSATATQEQWAGLVVDRAVAAARSAQPGVPAVAFDAPTQSGETVRLVFSMDHDERGLPVGFIRFADSEG